MPEMARVRVVAAVAAEEIFEPLEDIPRLSHIERDVALLEIDNVNAAFFGRSLAELEPDLGTVHLRHAGGEGDRSQRVLNVLQFHDFRVG
jgi:hypothetical protein